MNENPMSPSEKALRMNQDAAVYGTFAEIGAGQEVVRWFFQVGGAAGTVAKTISAYDMVVSDAIYGHTERYVSRKRLEAMLIYEYNLLLERLGPQRGDRSAFFSFADTTCTRSRKRHVDGHGWLGVRFQTVPGSEPSELIIHVTTLDVEPAREREAIGLIGVNLLYGAVYQHNEPGSLVASLMDNLSRDRVEIDMIKFSGPAFDKVDNCLMSLRLVEHGFTDAAMFTAAGEVVHPAEVLWQRPILVERGRFRPVNLLTWDLLEKANLQFRADPEVHGEEPVSLVEITVRALASQDGVDEQDFLDRVDVLRALGQMVLISNHGPYYRLVEHLSRYTRKTIAIALGMPALNGIMDDQHYPELRGGTLEAVGRLFARNVRMYLYPHWDAATNTLVTAETVQVPPQFRHLHAHLRAGGYIFPIERANPEFQAIDSDEVLRLIEGHDPAWERMVPPAVAALIKEKHLFGWKPA